MLNLDLNCENDPDGIVEDHRDQIHRDKSVDNIVSKHEECEHDYEHIDHHRVQCNRCDDIKYDDDV